MKHENIKEDEYSTYRKSKLKYIHYIRYRKNDDINYAFNELSIIMKMIELGLLLD